VADFRAVLADPEVRGGSISARRRTTTRRWRSRPRARGKHVIVEKPLTGFFGPPTTSRDEMLRSALATADQVLAAASAAGSAALLRGELGVRAAHPEGAAAAHRLRRPDLADDR